MRHFVGPLLLLFCFCGHLAQGQSDPADKVVNFPAKFFSSIQQKTASLDGQLTRQTQKYLAKLAKQEDRLRRKIARQDSAAAANLPPDRYASLAQTLKSDSARSVPLSGEYLPGIDSLNGSLTFLHKNQQVLASNPAMQAKLQQALSQFNQLQAKMQDAEAIKQYVQSRQAQIKQYLLSRFSTMPSAVATQYRGLQQQAYTYAVQVRAYKDMLNNPDQMTQKALALLNTVPSYQRFMKANSQLSGLLSVPVDYNTDKGTVGLQTHDQIMNKIQNQVGGSGSPGMASLQANLQNAQSQLSSFKDKLSQMGGGGAAMDVTDFKPKTTGTQTFFKRLTYGVNVQTTRDNYSFPSVTDLGLSVGYHLLAGNEVGIGMSYKLGWGNGIQHIAFSSNGVGLRSYLNIKIKSSFSATAGFEYNYTTPFTSYQQIENLNYWTKSGLVGITKTISVKSRFFKQTRVQLLWDFLSYSQIPKTNPLLFRIGYNF